MSTETARIAKLVEARQQQSAQAEAVYDEGIWFAPRSLWTVGVIDTAAVPASATAIEIGFNRENLRNGSRHPIQINRIAFSIVGNPYERTTEEDFTRASGGFHNMGGAINDVRARISVPFRQHYNREMPVVSSVSPRAVGQPPVQRTAGFENDSSLWGMSVLNFDRPLYIGRQTGIEWGLSSFTAMQVGLATGHAAPAIPANAAVVMPATMSWLEEGGFFAGSARSRKVNIRADSSVGRFVAALGRAPATDEEIRQLIERGQPLPLPFGTATPPAYAGTTDFPFWDPVSSYPGNDFKRHSATRGGAVKINGMTLALDQIDVDDFTTKTFGAGPLTETKMAQFSSSIGMRTRINGGVDSTWWARQGIPVNLFMDTVTSAAVYDLDVPLTLMPGDSVNLTVEVPGEALAGVDITAGRYSVGVALNGFTAIEG